VSAAVGRQRDGDDRPEDGLAAMAITTDAAVPREVIAEIVASDGFVDGRTVNL
jgi:D-3-phosphoglycerate dehydrogenase